MMRDLRDLAEEYAQNVIDKASYRKARSELIQGICAKKIKIKARQYLTPLKTVTDELSKTKENTILQPSKLNKNTTPTSKRPAQSYSSPWENKHKNILISAAIIVCLCVVVLLILLTPKSDPNKNHIPTADIGKQEIQSHTGQNLIIDFIQKKNWTEDSLGLFVTSWRKLANAERAAAQNSPEMKRLINVIYQQLLSERALLGLGDVKNAVANQRILVNFVEHLGIDDERFTITEPKLPLDTEILTEKTAN